MTIADKRPQLHPQVATRTIDGEAVVVLPREGQLEVLNETGTHVWELIDGTRTVREIAELIVGEYEVSFERAIVDVETLVGDLVRDSALVLLDV